MNILFFSNVSPRDPVEFQPRKLSEHILRQGSREKRKRRIRRCAPTMSRTRGTSGK